MGMVCYDKKKTTKYACQRRIALMYWPTNLIFNLVIDKGGTWTTLNKRSKRNQLNKATKIS